MLWVVGASSIDPPHIGTGPGATPTGVARSRVGVLSKTFCPVRWGIWISSGSVVGS